jgi:hypothetical protein
MTDLVDDNVTIAQQFHIKPQMVQRLPKAHKRIHSAAKKKPYEALYGTQNRLSQRRKNPYEVKSKNLQEYRYRVVVNVLIRSDTISSLKID